MKSLDKGGRMEVFNRVFNNIEDFLDFFYQKTKNRPIKQGNHHQAICPAHDDKVPSLSISDGGDKILLHCHAGCSIDNICNALGISKNNLFYKNNNSNPKVKKISKFEEILKKANEPDRRHPYILKKGIKPIGIKQLRENLVIPMYSKNTLSGLQFIDSNGNKKFAKGSMLAGSYFRIDGTHGMVFLCEGYATGATIHSLTNSTVYIAFSANNLKNVYHLLKHKYKEVVIAADNDHQKSNNTGITAAIEATDGNLFAKIVYPPSTDGVSDFNDLFLKNQKEAKKELNNIRYTYQVIIDTLQDKSDVEKVKSLQDLKNKLALLDELERELVFDYIEKTKILTKPQIKAYKKDIKKISENQEKEKKDDSVIVEDITPYHDDLDSEELANEILTLLNNYIYTDSVENFYLLTTYIFLTYSFEKFPVLPMLLLTSPVKRSGKTTTLNTLAGLVSKALLVGNISPAAVFRVIEKYKPTLLIDEVDAGLAKNEELRGILNAGHTKATAFVIRSGDKTQNFEPVKFNTFSPKILAMIGLPSTTWVDRSVIIKMSRKPTNVKLKKLPLDFFEKTLEIRQKLKKWSESTQFIDPPQDALPNIANDRAFDNYYPLLTISYNISEKWFENVKRAITNAENDEEGEMKIELLKDLYNFFTEKDTEKAATRDIVEYLNDLDERPWPDFRNGKGINARILAKMLKDFGVVSKNIKDYSKVAKGYTLEDLNPIFERYLNIKITDEIPF